MATMYRTLQGDMLDSICWRYYGQSSRAVEVVLEANPHLADLGEKYPVGLQIMLPEIDESTLQPEIQRKIKVFKDETPG